MSVEPRKKALVIAVSDYENLDKLDFCKKDGMKMLELLERKLGYTVTKKNLLGKVSGADIQESINEFFDDPSIRHDDTLLFYFTGHGLPKGTRHYLASSDVEPRTPGKTAMSFSELTELINDCNSECVITILDSCYAGAAGKVKGTIESRREKIKNDLRDEYKNYEIKQGKGRCFLFACEDNEEARSTLKGDHSFFTKHLIEGLKGGGGLSVNKEGQVTPESLMGYIRSKIEELPENERAAQTPLYELSDAEGKIILAQHYVKTEKDTFDVIKSLMPNLEDLMNAKPDSNDERDALLDFFVDMKIAKSSYHENKSLSKLFDTFRSKHKKDLSELINSAEAPNMDNWSFDAEKLIITNDCRWNGIIFDDTLPGTDNKLADFYCLCWRQGKDVIGKYYSHGSKKEYKYIITEKNVPEYKKVLFVKYTDYPDYSDMVKVINPYTLIGKCFTGNLEDENLFAVYVMAKKYAIEFMTEQDHDILLQRHGKDLDKRSTGKWIGEIISDDKSKRWPQLITNIKQQNNSFDVSCYFDDPKYSDGFIQKQTKKVKGLDLKEGVIKLITNNIIIGKINIDLNKSVYLPPHIWTRKHSLPKILELRYILRKPLT